MRACIAIAVALGCGGTEASPSPTTSGSAMKGTTAKAATSSVALADAGPIVVELFTSQGCSSCPPADQVLAKLAAQAEVEGRTVAPLAFHVDYWNDIGWVDPYSSEAWTTRQRRYAQALGDNRVYTPEIVVGGAAGMIGSHAGKVTAAITDASLPAKLDATATWTAHSVAITATAPADADVYVAVWEATRTNAVPSGENAGETLSSTRVVRKLERVAAAGTHGTLTVAVDPAWREPGAVAFAQRRDQAIVASALLPVSR